MGWGSRTYDRRGDKTAEQTSRIVAGLQGKNGVARTVGNLCRVTDASWWFSHHCAERLLSRRHFTADGVDSMAARDLPA